MKKNITPFVVTGLICFLGAYLIFSSDAAQRAAHNLNSAFERVTKTKTLRCGYFSRLPGFYKDPKTGATSGIFHDYVTQMAKNLGLKVVWAEEVTAYNYAEALAAGRIDAMCSGIWVTSLRAREADFIAPAYYAPVYAYARVDDQRFEKFTVSRFNEPNFKVAIMEESVTSILQRKFLPQTRLLEFPQMTMPSELFDSVANRQADIVLHDAYNFSDYNAHKPNILQRASQQPIRLFPVAIAIGKNQGALREMLNTATEELRANGTIEQAISRNEKYPNSYVRAVLPYQLSEKSADKPEEKKKTSKK